MFSILNCDDLSWVHDPLVVKQQLDFSHPISANLALGVVQVLGLLEAKAVLSGNGTFVGF